MMRSWRLLIEVGDKTPENPVALGLPPAPEVDRSKAWSMLVDARTKLVQAQGRGDQATVDQINSWIGGGLALMANLTNESAETLLARLVSEVPSGMSPTRSTGQTIAGSTLVMEEASVKEPQVAPGSNARFYQVERTRPAPPPGAPRDLDPADLTPEEREQLGILLPGEKRSEPEEEAPKPRKKAAAKKAPVKKKVVAKKPSA